MFGNKTRDERITELEDKVTRNACRIFEKVSRTEMMEWKDVVLALMDHLGLELEIVEARVQPAHIILREKEEPEKSDEA